MEEQLGKISQALDKLEILLSSAQRKVEDRDKQIQQKDERINQLTDKLTRLQQDKNDALEAKLQYMELLQNDKEQSMRTIHDQKVKILEMTNELEKLREVKMDMQDTVMGAGFEQDKLRKDLEQKEKELQTLQAHVGSGSTGILYNRESVVEYIKERVVTTTRTLRLAVPSVQFIEENGLMDLLCAILLLPSMLQNRLH